jgi:type I restriction enzyme M protein
VTVPGVIVILRKAKRDNAVLFIDGSLQCTRVGNKNELHEVHQQKILAAFTDRTEVANFARLVPNENIALEQYDLSVSKYVQRTDERAVIDIRALNAHIAEIVRHQSDLRSEIDAIVADLEGDSA